MTSLFSDAAAKHRSAMAQATAGQLSIIDLFSTAQELTAAGQSGMAVELYRTWLGNSNSPIAYAAWFNLGVLLSDRGDSAAAETCYRTAVAHNPRFSEGWLNLGTLLERLQRPNEALDAWRQVVSYANTEVEAERAQAIMALNNLGRLLEIQRDYPGAEEVMTSSLRLNPKQPDVITHWVHLRQKQCRWPVFDTALSGVALPDLMEATSALAMLSGSPDPAMQLASAKRFIRDKVKLTTDYLSKRSGYGHERLRIGYMSGDLCWHAVSILTAELYGLHDRNRVEVYGFDWSREDGSAIRARVVAGFDRHFRVAEMSDRDVAQLIRSQEIDILVDLHGLTRGARPDILSLRPAPVQMTWLGLPGTTGHPEIDYVIADDFVLPTELEPYFTEKPLRLPRCFQINDRQREVGPAPTRASLGLPEDAFVFCAFNNNFKITEDFFGAWMRILKRVPGSVLWLLSDNEQVNTNLLRRAELAGVAAERLIFVERAIPAEYLARYKVADLFLDTAPFNGGTTASDALWACLPVLTCAGRTFSSRMAGSLLRAVGLPELITFELDAYEEKAVALGLDRARALALRRQLEETRLESDLFDTPRFVRDLEDAFERVALKGEPQPAVPLPPQLDLPLVSVLIPTHNRPDYCELALQSVLAQNYPNLEVVISDNSENDDTERRLAPLVARDPRIRYLRAPGCGVMDNFMNCFHGSRGEFVNFLMDDDLYHPEKINRMMLAMASGPNVGLVTSFRQLIDADGNFLPPLTGTERLFEQPTAINGVSFAEMILRNGTNLVGEPTTAMFRRSLLDGQFGVFLGRQYTSLSDVATWLQVMTRADVVYLPEALSYFRIHGGQDQRNNRVRIESNVEWLQLLCDAHLQGKFLVDRPALQEMLTSKLMTCMWYMTSMHEDIKNGAIEAARIQTAVNTALGILLTRQG
ncbi:O-linked N-acetylglucosamine transferase family protein [Massilia endophytica]|uniref:O-linked N-acetylglucosamine transferase family protein n=1 Tax=Massilia endophytica TaxID=2899220 RepID=UPI001E36DDA8|nr:glycosyltransferase [Massilia endophytica]UGQ46607.1 glycosyltransferase [Massilia endophytica]